MYNSINTKNDVMKEYYISNCTLAGTYGFPNLEPIVACLDNLKPISFNNAIKEKNPKDSICHFFIDDMAFERVWNNCDKYIDVLKNFKYVCSPDFSMYSDMPKAMQIWQIYRNRALAFYLSTYEINVILLLVGDLKIVMIGVLTVCHKILLLQLVQMVVFQKSANNVIKKDFMKCVND